MSSNSAFAKIPVEPIQRTAYTIQETAESIGVSPRTLGDWMKQPGFPFFKINQTVRIPIDDLRRWLSDRAAGETCENENE